MVGLCALWCLSPELLCLGRGAAGPGSSGLAWGAAGLALALCLPVRPWQGVLVLLPVALLAPWEAWYILQYGRSSDAHVLGILSETDWSEASAFAAGWVGSVVALSLLGASLCLGTAWLARASQLAWRPARLRWWLVTGAAAAFVPALLAAWTEASQAADLAPWAPPEDLALARTPDPLLADLAHSFPSGVPLRIAHYLDHVAALRDTAARLSHFRFGARPLTDGPTATRQLHVVVIGETGRPDRWQLNGYARPTTPRLVAREDVISFRNMVSPWAWTRMSVPVILSRKPGTDRNPYFGERSLVSAFREAGYRTYWYSTQSPLGGHDSSIALMAREAHESRFVNAADYKAAGVHDDALLPWLDAVIARDEPKQLVVLHTLGSHYNYSHRYPPRFERFTPSLSGRTDAQLHDPSQASEMGNAYDNSVLFTDHVLAEAIERLERSGVAATLFYVADHGENLFDDGCPMAGHGRHTERDFRVASLLWLSERFRAQAPAAAEAARRQVDAPLSTSQVFPTLLHLAGLTVDRPDPRGAGAPGDLLHHAMPPGSRRVQNGLDFDSSTKEGACRMLRATAASRR